MKRGFLLGVFLWLSTLAQACHPVYAKANAPKTHVTERR